VIVAAATAFVAVACAAAPTTSAPTLSAPATTVLPSLPSLPTAPPTSSTKGTLPTGARPSATDSDFPELGAASLDVTHYDLDIDYDVEQQRLRATATLDAQVAAPTSAVTLDLQGLEVDSVKVDDRDATFATKPAKVQIDLPNEVEAQTPFRIAVRYHGQPKPIETDALGGVEIGWHAAEDGSFVLSEPEGASTWFPVNNHPRDKATYTFAVTVPKPYVAVANGRLDKTDEQADGRTFHWVMDAPMANYLATVVTGDFDEQQLGTHGSVTYSNWVPATDGASAGKPFAPDQPEVIAGLEEWLGPFPFSTYGAVIYPTSYIQGSAATKRFLSGVALETQGRSLYSERAADGETITHETAHQWMGDSVSIEDWGKDIWWVEGFAKFSESLDDPDRARQFEQEYAQVSRAWIPPGNLDRDELFGSGSYTEGAIVFYALEQEVGQPTFKKILKAFTERHRHANASTDDLIATASDVAGRDLQPFFDSWLFAETPPPFPS
jgi:aminopeptidase N